MERLITAPSHTQCVFNPRTFPALAQWAAELVRVLEPQAIVACGHSGLLIAGAVTYLTGVPTFAVRKPGEISVAGGSPRVSAYALDGPVERWVWLDDMVASGGTLNRAIETCVAEQLLADHAPIALLLYNRDWHVEGRTTLFVQGQHVPIYVPPEAV